MIVRRLREIFSNVFDLFTTALDVKSEVTPQHSQLTKTVHNIRNVNKWVVYFNFFPPAYVSAITLPKIHEGAHYDPCELWMYNIVERDLNKEFFRLLREKDRLPLIIRHHDHLGQTIETWSMTCSIVTMDVEHLDYERSQALRTRLELRIHELEIE